MTGLITLSGDYGYEPIKISDVTATEIDASGATWIVANIGSQINLYPIQVRDSGNVILTGGVINGQVSLTLDWRDAYVNSAAVFAGDVVEVMIQDWTISRAWDAIRFSGSASNTFTVDNVWLTDVRDDGIENDNGMSGTVSNSLFDGVFVGISLADSDTGNQTANLVTVDNVLIRMERYQYNGEFTHQSIFKVEAGISPGLSIHNSVFAIEDVNHRGTSRLEIAWNSVVSASNNYFLNLSDTPLPRDYPKPPAGFTILQGAEARAYWESARTDWIANHNTATGGSGPDITGTATADNLTGSAYGENIFGLKGGDALAGMAGSDRLFGHAGQDTLRGGTGDDVINGGQGRDQLVGGSGADRFVYKAGGADRVTDFELGLDKLAISLAMTGGMTDASQVISTFASDVGSDILFDFGGGNTVLLSGIGSTAGLSGDLLIF